ncbi:MAG: AzlC family ABC transporter permease [Anaerolineaceae bacterium]|nr:AzlC family ABC transporter permease [Anaerolineaceae bacterium]
MANTGTDQPKRINHPWLQGMVQAVPIVLGYIPVGFAYGVLAQKAGLSPFNTLLMSVIVYAGSAQLIAVGLISSGLTPLSIIITTFIVNLRHMLMSAALSPHLQTWRKPELAGFAYELTDESFAVHATRINGQERPKSETIAINVTAQASWVLGTALGIFGGQMIADIEPFALDYALPAMFIALLVMQIKNKVQVIVAVLAGVFSLGLYLIGFRQWYVIIATVLAATLGVVLEKWTKRPSF